VNSARSELQLLLIFFILSVASCSKQNQDANLQKKLTGNWVLESAPFSTNKFQSRFTVDPHGNYMAHCSQMTVSNTVLVFEIEGIYQVKNGYLIDTMIDNSMVRYKTNLPHFMTNSIVQLTSRQLIMEIETGPNEKGEVTFRKEQN